MNKSPPLDQSDKGKAEFIAAAERGIADANSGRTIAYKDVRRWLLSWGVHRELPIPKCK